LGIPYDSFSWENALEGGIDRRHRFLSRE
jgi:hypothetical protein